jgi:nitrilase
LAVCYDVRFPELFRSLQAQGAQAFTLPAAFTVPTGTAHWEVLLRARAIENLCYVLAPAQWGRHANGRDTYGDSMIVSPWGEVLDRKREGEGLAIAEIDLSVQAELRESFPCLSHRRLPLVQP